MAGEFLRILLFPIRLVQNQANAYILVILWKYIRRIHIKTTRHHLKWGPRFREMDSYPMSRFIADRGGFFNSQVAQNSSAGEEDF